MEFPSENDVLALLESSEDNGAILVHNECYDCLVHDILMDLGVFKGVDNIVSCDGKIAIMEAPLSSEIPLPVFLVKLERWFEKEYETHIVYTSLHKVSTNKHKAYEAAARQLLKWIEENE